MLAMVDTPDFLEEMHKRSQGLARGLYERLRSRAEKVRVKAGTDLMERSEPCFAFVRSGVLKFMHGQRVVRLYSDNDLLIADRHCGIEGCAVEATFACEISLLPRTQVLAALQSTPDLICAWLEFAELENQIMHVLCGLYASSEIQPEVRFKRFEAGEVIVEQGTECSEIFSLVEGRAIAVMGGAEVGTIREGEFIGEISFLTGNPCSATVTAGTDCFVQMIDKDQFRVMVQSRPSLAVDLARVLAERVVALGERVADV